MRIDLCGKTAVVTGASAGIGRGCARGLARVGATVVMVAGDGAAFRYDRRKGVRAIRRCRPTSKGTDGLPKRQRTESVARAHDQNTTRIKPAGTSPSRARCGRAHASGRGPHRFISGRGRT